MATDLHRLSQQEAANAAANPVIKSKTVTFDGTTNNGKILAAATLSTSLTGANNDLDYTAVTQGSAGNNITIAYVDPGAINSALAVSVNGTAISISLATTNSAKATQTLTSDATAPSDGDAVLIGAYTYIYKTTLTGSPFEVLIGASAAAALDNLKSAINNSTGEGTTYGTGTAQHPQVVATTNTDTTQVIEAKFVGAYANAIATTETSSHLSWGAATMAGGADGGAISTTSGDIDTAIAGTPAADALVGVANKAGNDGSGVVTAMAATNLSGGSDGYIELFTLDEDYNVVVFGTCIEDLTGATATLSVGYTGQTTIFVPATTATTIDNTMSIDKTGTHAEGTAPDSTPFRFVLAGTRIRAYVGTATITDGTVTFYLVTERPLGTRSNNSAVTSVIPGTTATALGKAEDAAHVSGDTGVMVLAKRTDTAASSAGTDGDYATFNVDANGHQWIREGYAPGYEDNTVGVAKVEQRFTPTFVQADTLVKSGAGFLHTLTFSCNDAAPTAGSIIVYDNTAESGTVIFNHTFTTTPFTPFTVTINGSFSTGLYVGFTTTNDVNVTVSYR